LSSPGPENVNPPSSSLGVESLSRALSVQPPPTPLLRPDPAEAESSRSRVVGCLSWGSCSHERTTSGAPCCHRSGPRAESTGEGRQTLAGAVLRVLAPLDGSGFLARGTHGSLAEPAVRRGPQRFAALFHAARVPGTALQSFPFPKSRTCSRRPLAPLRVSPPVHRRRRAAGNFTVAFSATPALCPDTPPGGGGWTHEPGQRFLAIARTAASTRP